MTDVNSPFLTGPEVLARYRISEPTLRRWISHPEVRFPAPIRGAHRSRLFRITDLETWEAARQMGVR